MVIMDVTTGEILAMVNLPTYNPNSLTGAILIRAATAR